MDIFECGVSVQTKLNKIEGIITGITIRFDAINYEVSYFHEGAYKQVWLNEAEFEVKNEKKQVIGFRKE